MAKTKAKTKDKEKPKRPEGPRARNDAYVMMLFLTLIAILGGTALMYLDYDEYGSKVPQKEVIPTVADLGKAAKAAETAGGGAPGGGGGEKGMP
jgi:hypothetical protein